MNSIDNLWFEISEANQPQDLGENDRLIFPPFVLEFIDKLKKLPLTGTDIQRFGNTIDELVNLWKNGYVDENGKPTKKKI